MGCQKIDYKPEKLFFYPCAFTPNGEFLNYFWHPEGGFTTDGTLATINSPKAYINTYVLKY